MVKLTGPMMSITALGKFGKVMVFSIWKGIQYARMLITPVNPQSADQGNRRVMLGGLGRSPKYIQVETVYFNHAKELAPAGQSWISYYIKYIMDTYFTNVAGFDAIVAAYGASGIAADFNDDAIALGLTTFDLAYKDMDTAFSPGMQLYCLALYGTDQYLLDNTKFNSAPYTKAFGTWIDTDIDLMVADFSP